MLSLTFKILVPYAIHHMYFAVSEQYFGLRPRSHPYLAQELYLPRRKSYYSLLLVEVPYCIDGTEAT